MKLRNWQIDGFGLFSKAGLPDPGLCDGFNLFIGPNEAGKSTLLDFLRYTLFGYPSSQRRQPRREPLRGGSHSGTLIYEAEDLICQLYREAANKRAFQLRDQNGTQLTDADLRRHLGHIGPDVFRNILGFSLAELQELKSLTEGDVRDLIFAASIGQSAARIHDLEDSLSKKADNIFREGARPTAQNAPSVVKLRYELDRLERQLAEAAAASRAIGEKVKELENKKNAVRALDKQLEDVKHEIQRLERLISGWPLWVERCHAQEERDGLGDVSCFPPNGDAIWATCKTEFDNARQLARARYAELQVIKEKLSGLPTEFPLLTLIDDVNQLATNRSDYDVAVRLSADAKSKAAEDQQRWEEVSEELGTNWPEEIVRSFDVSLFAEDDARRLAEELRDAELVISNKRTHAVNLAREARALSTDCSSKVKQVEGILKSGPLLQVEEITHQRTTLAELREASRHHEWLRSDFGRAQDHLSQVNLYTTKREPAEPIVPAWLPLSLVLGAIVLAVFAVVLLYFGQLLGAGMSAAFALLLGSLAAILRSRMILGQDSGEIPPELRGAQTRYATTEKALQDHDNYWKVQASQVGFSWPTGESELSAWESRISVEERRSVDAKNLLEELQGLRSRRRAKHSEFKRAKNDFEESKRVHSNLLRDWIEFLKIRQLPQTIRIETAMSIFGRVKEARQKLRDFDNNTDVGKERDREAQAYIQELECCLQRANLPVSDNPAKILAQFERLCEQLQEQHGQSQERRGCVCELSSAKKNLREAIRVARILRRKTRSLLTLAGVSDEPGFVALGDRAKKYSELTHSISQKETALATIFGQSVPSELQKAWDNGNHPDWETDKFEAENEERTVTVRRDETLRAQTTLEIEINSQVGSDEVARLQLEGEELREEIRKGIQEWLDLATALELLRRTREKFEQENQSPALEEASRLFRVITDGRYERIFIPLDSTGADLTILPQVGPALFLDCLSRGTLELLLLCIRLGYLQQFQKQRGLTLPLLMDDVTVNFDPERMARTFAALAECSRNGQQIVFFTCHEELVKLLRPEDRCFSIRDFQFEREAFGPLLMKSA